MDTLKLLVTEDGLHRVTGAELEKAGLPPSQISPDSLRLTHQGRDVPLLVKGRGREAVVEFYGVAADTRYTGINVYRLRAGHQPGMGLTARSVTAPTGRTETVVWSTLRREENRRYWTKTSTVDEHWYWQTLTAPVTVTLVFTLPHRAPGPADLRVAFLGGTRGPASPNHRVVALVNGQEVGQAAWDGQTRHLLVAQVPESVLHDGENKLTLAVSGARPDLPDLVLLDWFEVSYPRRLVAEEDRLSFVGGGEAYRTTGFSGPEVAVFDVTDPYVPLRLTGAQVEPDGDGYAVSFQDPEPRRRYLLVGPKGRLKPAGVKPWAGRDLRATRLAADYIIITHPDFAAGLQALIAWRRSQGLRVVLVTVDEIYDAFSGGLTDPAAIRDFLRHARQTWEPPAPRFVLLVGKASYDYRDYLGAPNKNLVPTMMVPTVHLGEAASDNWFVAEEGGSVPVMAIGRLPVKTPAQLRTVVDKILAYEKDPPPGDWQRRVVYVADDKEPVFARFSEALAQDLPPGFQAERLFMQDFRPDLDALRARVLGEWNRGAAVMSYIGHGALRTWAAEGIFIAEDVAGLRNDGRLPVLVTPTCLDGFFAHPEEDSLTEELLFKADGGIIAGFVPTGLTTPGQQEPLVQTFYREVLHEGATLGEAILEAKRALPNSGQGYEDVLETFTLLGDPATKLVGRSSAAGLR